MYAGQILRPGVVAYDGNFFLWMHENAKSNTDRFVENMLQKETIQCMELQAYLPEFKAIVYVWGTFVRWLQRLCWLSEIWRLLHFLIRIPKVGSPNSTHQWNVEQLFEGTTHNITDFLSSFKKLYLQVGKLLP